jgi:hypothetical protein
MGGFGQLLPRNVAQLTGVIVSGIVGFGTDTDLFVAIPLGVLAGALAALFVWMSEPRRTFRPRTQRAQQARWQDYRRDYRRNTR